jgi:hypothetical protein
MGMRSTTKHSVVFLLAASLLLPAVGQAEVIRDELPGEFVKVYVRDDPWQPENLKEGIPIPVTYTSSTDIFLDGMEKEAAWATTPEVTVPLSFGSVDSVQLRALYTDEDIIVRVRWADATEDRQHHPWVWDEELGDYKVGPQVEDSLMFSFEAGCEWFPSFLSGYDFDFDAWQWLAGRSDPLGQALDLSGSMKDAQLSFNQRYNPRYQEDDWNLRITDTREGILHWPLESLDRQFLLTSPHDTVYYHANLDGSRGQEFVRQLQPPEILPSSPAPVLPQFEPLALEGNAAEVRAKGHWEDGYWTVELRRVLITEGGGSYDIQMHRLTQFSIQVYDHVERLDESSESGRLFFQFLEKEPIPENQLAQE